jgi:two-component system sensor histidine kinase QseC
MKLNKRSSIRSRLIFSLLMTLLVILGYTTYSSYRVSRHEADEAFGARLATSARILESLIANQTSRSTLNSPIIVKLPQELEDLPVAEQSKFGHTYEAKIAFQIWHDDGLLLARSYSAPETPLGEWRPGFSVHHVAGEKWQVFTLRAENTWVKVAEHDGIREELTNDMAIAVMTPLILGSLALLLVANLVVRFGLNPLTELAEGIGKRNPESLYDFRMDDVPEEMTPVIKALNALLVRIKDALARERRFTDAAAHELRTPLAALKIHADNLVRAETEEQRQRSTGNLIKGLDRSLRLANQMLILSRTQSKVDSQPFTRIDLTDILREIVAQQESVFAVRGQRIVAHGLGLSDALVEGDELKLHQLFRNLFDNASRYGNPDSTIRMGLEHCGNEVIFSLANEGPLIPEDMRDKVFEPYTRLAGQGSEGNGLGLAIVREVADQHGARISLEASEPQNGMVIRIFFPFPAST